MAIPLQIKINEVSMINQIFKKEINLEKNFILRKKDSSFLNQRQTNEAFSEKWRNVNNQNNLENYFEFQYDWYLKLYGFSNENELGKFLSGKKIILDAGCGIGYKAAWFAKLSPKSTVIGMDFSAAAEIAAKKYEDIPNLFFVQGDIADTGLKKGIVDFISCDQVLQHTEDPQKTFEHLSYLLSHKGEIACYVYAKKALPRELIDDYFRDKVHEYSKEEIWDLSSQITELGRRLSDLNIRFTTPDIPLLGIKGGEYDIQRFIYWNFLKCFWRDDWSEEFNISVNFDWYSPSNATRYSEEEFRELIKKNHLNIIHFYQEEACYSGRFTKE